MIHKIISTFTRDGQYFKTTTPWSNIFCMTKQMLKAALLLENNFKPPNNYGICFLKAEAL